MAQAMPIHIINEIERRWQRQVDARPQTRPGKNDDGGVGACPLCNASAPIEPAVPGDTVPWRDYVCSGCGHAWRDEGP